MGKGKIKETTPDMIDREIWEIKDRNCKMSEQLVQWFNSMKTKECASKNFQEQNVSLHQDVKRLLREHLEMKRHLK